MKIKNKFLEILFQVLLTGKIRNMISILNFVIKKILYRFVVIIFLEF